MREPIFLKKKRWKKECAEHTGPQVGCTRHDLAVSEKEEQWVRKSLQVEWASHESAGKPSQSVME